MTRFDDARSKNIVDVIRHYNIDITQNGYLHCPFCSSDRKFDGAIDKNKFKCFHCGINASTIDFVIQKGIENNSDGKRFVRNLGNTAPVPIKAYDHNKYMIVEGIEDGLTALILGYNFITLNSIQNAGRLMELLDQHEDWLKNNTFISCLDNDEGGNECTEKLKAYFFSKGLVLRDSRYRRKMIECNMKDLNQFYISQNNRKRGTNEEV